MRRRQCPVASGHSSSAASSKVPGPVPRSRIRFGPVGAGEMLDGRSDQRLAVGARHQRARADFQVDRPEGAMAGDIGDRLARPRRSTKSKKRCRRLARRDCRGSAGRGRCRAHAAISSSASSRGVSLVVRSCCGGAAQRPRDGGHASSRPASRSASSSATSASTSSPSPGPSRIASSLCSVRLMRWSVTRPCGKL